MINHSFIAVDTNLLSDETKNYIPNFWRGKFSNDGRYILISGFNKKGELTQGEERIKDWLKFQLDPNETLNSLLSTLIEYTKEEIEVEFMRPESMWYITPVNDE